MKNNSLHKSIQQFFDRYQIDRATELIETICIAAGNYQPCKKESVAVLLDFKRDLRKLFAAIAKAQKTDFDGVSEGVGVAKIFKKMPYGEWKRAWRVIITHAIDHQAIQVNRPELNVVLFQKRTLEILVASSK